MFLYHIDSLMGTIPSIVIVIIVFGYTTKLHEKVNEPHNFSEQIYRKIFSGKEDQLFPSLNQSN